MQFLRPDMALVHIDWETHGDLDFDLKPWPLRKDIFSWLVMKTGADWKIRSVQNTDSTAPPVQATRTSRPERLNRAWRFQPAAASRSAAL